MKEVQIFTTFFPDFLISKIQHVHGVPTSFGWKALIKNLKSARIWNFEIFCQKKKIVKLKCDLHCLA